jgi:hypothetical protein
LDTPLAALAKGVGWVSFHEFGLPTVKDGFLATNSLLATCVLLARAYRHQQDRQTRMALPLVAFRRPARTGRPPREARQVSWACPAISDGRVRDWPWQ